VTVLRAFREADHDQQRGLGKSAEVGNPRVFTAFFLHSSPAVILRCADYYTSRNSESTLVIRRTCRMPPRHTPIRVSLCTRCPVIRPIGCETILVREVTSDCRKGEPHDAPEP